MTQELIEGFLEAIPLPAVLVDQTERFIGANAAGTTLLGQQLKGRHFATILRQPGVTAAIEACLQDKSARTARHLSNDGAQDTTFEVSLRYVPGIGAVNGGAVLLCFTDVTEREQAGQMRRDFVANVSHELRTPLTALMGFIETLRGAARDDPAARDRFLAIMEGEASRMNRLVGDLLSLNRVESAERVRPKEKLDLTAHLTSTLKSMQPLAEAGNVALSLEAPDEPVHVTGDSDQLQQVFTNLIENAIKYGGDEVRVVLTPMERDPALRAPAARIQVIDNGPGIDPVHLPRLTERFYRADSHRSRELGGTGLGLAIVKHIINRHRGRLRVESDLGAGASFTVILPQ
ncbi:MULTISPECIES: ATP-binding protein [Rhodobacterales]|jgi:two-component system phosphate regulon sensor histidine kinase PhoR|uniref:ATP-binding protein n=1 Tax=Rhodobacterales TaxID=204455 RepID=UPI00237FD4CC|nr:ATP-binding protein [Phaeobacter gallaeciensis]MEC9310670.1 ATP-binding protein [Pseudomonadota bacterium]MDE4096470.1 ATP-binding protein [Phaeobacter gallaeciensis]MDE4105281.1 ATP-binding protein [Phaeobacter gallaeciensis]MDE4109737.1 ATP-binding protein [Phaeobacter gallaeciensis]MDE4114205.1 ATP-binding protein [Phaeobacter gallaeciensis]